MVTIEIKDNKLVITVLGLHRLWTCKKQIELTREKIKSVKPANQSLKPAFFRCPGTYIPGVIIAGTYYGRKRKEFWDTRLKGKAIEINLENDKYTKLVVDVEDPNRTIREIQNVA